MTEQITRVFVPEVLGVLSVGIQSRIDLGMVAKSPAIRKVCGEDLSFQEGQIMVDAIGEYRKQLASAGIRVPRNYELYFDGGLVMVDERVQGLDVDKLVKMGDTGSWKKMVGIVCRAANSGVMLDAKAGNFIDTPRGMYYVDFYPPALKDDRGMISPFIEHVFKRSRELFTFNYGDIRGLCTKLLALARREYGDIYPKLVAMTLGTTKKLLNESAHSYIKGQVEKTFPDMNIFYGTDQVKSQDRLKELLNG